MSSQLSAAGEKKHRLHEALERSHEHVPPATWVDVRSVMVGTLLWVLALNVGAIWYLANHSPNRGPRVIKTKWRLLDEAPHGTNMLVLGDSSGLRGVVPKILNERLGVQAINLGTTRRMLVTTDAWMLERFIARHGAPERVLVVHVYEVWHGDKDWLVSAMADIPMNWGFWERMKPASPLLPSDQFRVFLNRYVPLYADNQSLATLFQKPWKAARYFASIGVDETGYMPIKSANPREVEADRARNLAAVRGKTFVMSGMNRMALERIRELAEAHGFDVYLANSPLYEGLYKEPEFKAYYQQVQGALRAFTATSPRLHYIAQEPWTFRKDQLENCDHVTEPASVIYTNKLADEIRRLKTLPPRPRT